MFLGEPQQGQYDWRFPIFGFPVRVTWLFWAVSAALGYNWAMGMHRLYAIQGIPSHFAMLLLIWVAVMFVSILVHELGHAFAFRFYGVESEIVLYQMGGLAIPGAGMIWGRMGQKRRLSHVDQIVISSAGPVIQLILAATVGITATLCGNYVEEFAWLARWLDISVSTSRNPITAATIRFMVTASIYWAVFNLVPIYPLDGGHIAQHLFAIFRRTNGLMEAHMLGAIVGILGAFWFYQQQSLFNAMFLASMAFSNIQSLQSNNGSRFW